MSKRDTANQKSEVLLRNELGETLLIKMKDEGGERLGLLFIEDIPYHVFFARVGEIGAGGKVFIVDRDPSYRPRLNTSETCVLIAPYCDSFES
jgi:hypothetical protein